MGIDLDRLEFERPDSHSLTRAMRSARSPGAATLTRIVRSRREIGVEMGVGATCIAVPHPGRPRMSLGVRPPGWWSRGGRRDSHQDTRATRHRSRCVWWSRVVAPPCGPSRSPTIPQTAPLQIPLQLLKRIPARRDKSPESRRARIRTLTPPWSQTDRAEAAARGRATVPSRLLWPPHRRNNFTGILRPSHINTIVYLIHFTSLHGNRKKYVLGPHVEAISSSPKSSPRLHVFTSYYYHDDEYIGLIMFNQFESICNPTILT